jgi:hypothetical protein
MANTFTLIASKTVPTDGTSSVTFSSIPATYTDLCLKMSARKANNDYDIELKFNGSSTGYSGRYLEGNGAAASSGSYSSLTQAWSGLASTNNQTASTFGNSEIYIPNYAGSTNKSFSVDAVNENNGTTAYADLLAWLWSNTSAITSIELNANGSTFATYSNFYLYGIKNS